jgi:hypothetical protein
MAYIFPLRLNPDSMAKLLNQLPPYDLSEVLREMDEKKQMGLRSCR